MTSEPGEGGLLGPLWPTSRNFWDANQQRKFLAALSGPRGGLVQGNLLFKGLGMCRGP